MKSLKQEEHMIAFIWLTANMTKPYKTAEGSKTYSLIQSSTIIVHLWFISKQVFKILHVEIKGTLWSFSPLVALWFCLYLLDIHKDRADSVHIIAASNQCRFQISKQIDLASVYLCSVLFCFSWFLIFFYSFKSELPLLLSFYIALCFFS